MVVQLSRYLIVLISILFTLGASSTRTTAVDPVSLYATPAEYASLQREFQAIKDQIRKVDEEHAKHYGCNPEDIECQKFVRENPDPLPSPDEPWVVFDCGYSPGVDPALENSPLPISTLGILTAAKVSLYIQDTFTGTDYPESLWKQPLADYEQEALLNVLRARYIESHELADYVNFYVADYPYQIVLDLQVYRSKVNPKLHEVQAEEGCGAGEFGVRIQADGAASVSIIPEFLARVCQLEQPTAEIKDCRYWADVPLDEPVGVSGAYRYRVTWANGTVTDGSIDFDRISQGKEDEDGNAILTISQ
jgi:hypothetical protein